MLKKIVWMLIGAIIVIAIFWWNDILPQHVAKIVAINYIEAKYPEKKLAFIQVEYGGPYGEYLVHFMEPSGKKIIFFVEYKYLPFWITRDPYKILD
jgi:hypothetical protein